MAKSKKQLFTAIESSSCRARYEATPGTMHRIEFTFKNDQGDTLIVEMDHDNASKLLESAFAAYQAIQRPLKFARMVPFA